MNGGALSIQADWTADDGIRILSVRLERPPVAKLFVGMTGDELLAAVPLLYSLCAQAQRAAAAAALAAARHEPPPAVDARALWRENLHERLWRICLDWPAASGRTSEAQQAARAAFVAWRKRFDVSPEEATAAMLEFLSGKGTVPQGLGEKASNGEAAYLTCLQQAQDTGQALRENRPCPMSAQGNNGGGEARIQTARGKLTHRLTLDAAGRIASYQVCAPTDRHFADAAALMARLTSVRPANFAAARQVLECAVLALDPCVPYQITWLKPEQEH